MVGDAWKLGDIEVRSLVASKCEYLAGYTVKKMTKGDDARLLGRHPEFSRQSRRPGIGASYMVDVARLIERYFKAEEIIDVPSALAISHKPIPLGRYLRSRLRLELGLEEGTPDEVLRAAWYEQVLPVLKVAKASKEAISFREAFRQANQNYADTLAARARIFSTGGRI